MAKIIIVYSLMGLFGFASILATTIHVADAVEIIKEKREFKKSLKVKLKTKNHNL